MVALTTSGTGQPFYLFTLSEAGRRTCTVVGDKVNFCSPRELATSLPFHLANRLKAVWYLPLKICDGLLDMIFAFILTHADAP